jgi:hypothetical protein
MDGQRSSILGSLMRPAAFAIRATAMLWHKATEGGHLAAFGRQGLGELAEALKAFPDTIQVHEYGTIFHPTQGEIGKGNATAMSAHADNCYPSPSDIVASHGGGHGQQQDAGPTRSPSDIVAEHGGVQGAGQTWQEKEIERRQKQGENDSDGYERGQGRSLPDEQREQEQEQGRDRSRGR